MTLRFPGRFVALPARARPRLREPFRPAARRTGVANDVRRVEAVVGLENEASSRVLERLGFRREGAKRRLLRHGGGWAGATLDARLADD